jgi:glycosyltransferase involved in cell wall biosynthesis
MNVSVAMCTFNGATYLRAQLDSIVAQTRLPDELVIFDDCSGDATRTILEAFSVSAPFPVSVHYNEHNLGSTRNFESAIRACQGEAIALTDQDDVWRPHKLQILEQRLAASSDVGCVFSDALVVDERLRSLGYTLWQSIRFTPKEQRQLEEARTYEVLLKHSVVTGATMMFRAEFRDKFLPIPESWIHDGWIALMIGSVARLFPEPLPLIDYRQHPAHRIGTNNSLLIEARTAGDSHLETLRRRIIQFEAAYDRLQKMDEVDQHADLLERVQTKIQHVRARSDSSTSLLRWLTILLCELLTGRYARYSSGLLSFLKDIATTGRIILSQDQR